MLQTELDMEILRMGRIDEDVDGVGVIGIRFEVVNSSMFLFTPPPTLFQSMGVPFLQRSMFLFTPPPTLFQSMGVPFLQRMTASMRDFIDEDTAYHCSSRMLADVLRVFDPDEIPSFTAEVACMLWYWTHQAIQRRFNSLELEIRVDIIEHYYGSYDDHHTYAHQEEEEEEEEEEDDADDITDDDEEEEEEEEIMLAWATTESMNSGGTVSHGLFGSSSADEVGAFLRSWRVQTWESKTQCTVCLDWLGEAGGFEDEEEEEKDQGSKEEKDSMICQLPCNHLFHGECISRWLEGRDNCPLCRTTLHV